jgi:hypothetical protein
VLFTAKWASFTGYLLVKLKSSLRKFYRCHYDLVNRYGTFVSLVVNIFRSFPHSWLIAGFLFRVTRWVPLVEQELPTLSEHLNLPPIFSGIHVTRPLVLCVMFCRSLFVLLSYCVVSPFFDLRILNIPLLSSNSTFSYFMARTSYISMRLQCCPLRTWPTRLVGFFIVIADWNSSPWS